MKRFITPLAIIAIVIAMAAGASGSLYTPMTAEQIEQERIHKAEQAEQERIHKAEQAERERIRKAEQAQRDRIRQEQLRPAITFTELVRSHTAKFQSTMAASKAAKNAMVSTDGMKQTRDAEVFALLKASNFKFQKWEASIVEIEGPRHEFFCPQPVPACIKFTVRMTVPNGLVLRVTVPQTPGFTSFLTQRKAGEVIVISGQFFSLGDSSSTASNPTLVPRTPGSLEVSITDRGSMEDPEYAVLVDAMQLKQ
jgi:hypothetical protein